ACALCVSRPARLASELSVADGSRPDATARLVAICRAVGADTYLAGRDGALYPDASQVAAAGIAVPAARAAHVRVGGGRCVRAASQFASAGIAVTTQRYDHPAYAQSHGEFAPFLSA